MDFTTAWLTTNRSCNNRCTWCYAFNSLNNPNSMDFEKAKLLVADLKTRNVKKIILIGGEPTLYPHFIDLIKFIRQQDIRVSVASNGKMFKNKAFAKSVIDTGINSIDFSIKAITEEEYFKNTSTFGLSDMLTGYRNLRDLGFTPSVSYVIVDDNKERFNNFIHFIQTNNMNHLSLQFVKPTLSLDKIEPIMDLKKMGKFVSYIYEAMSKTKINYSIEISFPLCLLEANVLESLAQKNRIINCCHVPRGSGINFDENFKIIPCNHFGEFPFSDSPIDFNNKNSIETVMESKMVKDFRHKARCYPAPKCETCSLWEKCGGGCFTRWLTLNPNDYIY